MLQDTGGGGGRPPATTPNESPVRRPLPSPIVVQAEPLGALPPHVSMWRTEKPCREQQDVGPRAPPEPGTQSCLY